eukprot:10564988-Lingulodinium_polyedra.AAC.1
MDAQSGYCACKLSTVAPAQETSWGCNPNQTAPKLAQTERAPARQPDCPNLPRTQPGLHRNPCTRLGTSWL